MPTVLTAQLARINASNAQVVLVLVSGTPFGTVLRGMHDTGMELPVFASPANMNRAQLGSYAGFLPSSLTFLGFSYQSRDQEPKLRRATSSLASGAIHIMASSRRPISIIYESATANSPWSRERRRGSEKAAVVSMSTSAFIAGSQS